MPLSTVVILSTIVAMFVAFILVVGVISTWLNISEAREQSSARRRNRADALNA